MFNYNEQKENDLDSNGSSYVPRFCQYCNLYDPLKRKCTLKNLKTRPQSKACNDFESD